MLGANASTRLLLSRLTFAASRSQLHAALSSTSRSSSGFSTDESKWDGRESAAGKDRSRSPSTSSQPQPHWLDRRAPAAAEWLDAQSRELWLRGLEERCRSVSELSGHELLLQRLVSEKAEALMRRHSGRFLKEEEEEVERTNNNNSKTTKTTTVTKTTTSRARTHLQAAALVRATGDALLPFFRGDEQKVLEVLKDSTGGRVSCLLKAMLRLQARFASLLPSSSSPDGAAERRLRLMMNDYGGAWPGAEVVVVEEGKGGDEEEEEKKNDGGGEKRGEKTDSGGFFSSSLLPLSFLGSSSSSSPSASAVRLKTTTTTLRISRCLYHEVMANSDGDGGEEGNDGDGSDISSPSPPPPSSLPPRWLEACCCSVDGLWFEPWISKSDDDGSLSALARKGRGRRGSLEPLVSFRRRSWLGDSGGGGGAADEKRAACELCVTRIEAARSRMR